MQPEERLWNLWAGIADSYEELTDRELRRELKAEGCDLGRLASHTRAVLRDAVELHYASQDEETG